MIYIRKCLKILTSIFTLFLLVGLMSTGTSHAETKVLMPSKVNVTITNDQTGEITVLDTKVKMSSIKDLLTASETDSKVVGYDVFIPIEDPNAPTIGVLDDSGGSKTSGGVTARLYVDYDTRSSNSEIRLNKVWGSWTPSHPMYYLSDRKVDAHDGPLISNELSKKPTSDSFTYTTGWGYSPFATGQGSPRAWSSAKVQISGMSGTSHTITLDLPYP